MQPRPSQPVAQVHTCVTALRDAGIDVDTSARRLAEYSYDASNYRLRPTAVAFPANAEEVAFIVRTCHAAGMPVVGRGGGTSMAGNAVGTGLVIDFSRHVGGVLRVDETECVADIEPGVVLSELSRQVEAATEGRLTFAPDPSSRTRATVGGAIGNDACGNHSVRYGRMSDHVVALDLVTADGVRLTAHRHGLTATDPEDATAVRRAAEISASLSDLAGRHLSAFRLELGRIPRQVSGFHLSHLLPEHGFDVARSLVGSEGTCALVVGARVRLVEMPRAARLLCLGYADVVEAARDVETILQYRPAAVEGIDEAIVETMRLRRGKASVRGLPDGNAWLYVDLDGDDLDSVAATGRELLDRLKANGRLIDGRVVADAADRASLWRVREDGAGLSARLASGDESWPGWEDAAVAPERLADYLADFRELMAAHGLHGVLYGHFGAGCTHVRVTFDLRSEAGRQVMRDFVRAAAELVVSHGGSLSGEHGDGRARSELLPLMYSAEMIEAFEEFKRIWDPDGLLNPGVIVRPESLNESLVLADVPVRRWPTSFDLTPVSSGHPSKSRMPEGTGHGVDPFVRAVQGCVGIGRCRSTSGGVMCPSYRATRDEKDSTRGRARVLQDMVRGAGSTDAGWRSDDVREALDLCLSCKACASDCPAGVDMATYKSEFLDHYYRGRLRPLSHYSLGWLPRWLRVIGHVAPLANAVLASPLATVVAKLGGLTQRRALPRFAAKSEVRRQLAGGHGRKQRSPRRDGVVLLVDTFTQSFRPQVAGAALRVLQTAVDDVECRRDVCCGLTWISTGQLTAAKRRLQKACDILDDGTDRPIVVIEPSCAAAFKTDLPELLATDAARRVATRIRSFSSMIVELTGRGWQPCWPDDRAPAGVTVQTHCHEYSVFGAATQRRALQAVGVNGIREVSGCCGVAGNFGFEANHFDVSMRVAEQSLAPAMRAAPEIPILTDGFSCQMQVRQLDPGRRSSHLAELLDPGKSAAASGPVATERPTR
jgi:FAD/FMN-containing dehydrogenase/Fe-S oxidoreductase